MLRVLRNWQKTGTQVKPQALYVDVTQSSSASAAAESRYSKAITCHAVSKKAGCVVRVATGLI